MKKLRIILFVILLPLGLAGAKIATIGKNIDPQALNPYILSGDASQTGDVKIHFYGTSCFTFQYKGSTLLNDPFFSNPDFIQLTTGRYKNQAALIKEHLKQLDSISLITITHGHYDHCLDVPAFSHLFTTQSKLVCDQSIFFELNEHLSSLHSVENVTPSDASEQWIYSSDSVFRVMPVLSIHSDHFLKIKLFGGSYDRPLDSLPGPVWQWKEGQTYSFVIDVLNNGNIHRRFFMGAGQVGESSMEVLGKLAEERRFDIIFPAFWHQKKSGPNMDALRERLQPEMVVMHHWNNFFKHPEEAIQAIRSTQLETTLESYKANGKPVYIMMPFSEMTY